MIFVKGLHDMKFYTDGSRIGLHKGEPILGWASVCDLGVVSTGSQVGGSNINAEMFAIKSLLEKLYKYKRKLIEFSGTIEIVTDSLTSIQIITGYQKNPNAYKLEESINYQTAKEIVNYINLLKVKLNKNTVFTHVNGHEKNIGNNFADYVATQESEKLSLKLKGEE